MKCLFCPLTDLNQVDENGLVFTYDCENCGISYFIVDNETVGWHFYKDYNDYRFFVTWLEYTNETSITKAGKGETMSKVITLKGTPSLNPHNIVQKLPTILTFL